MGIGSRQAYSAYRDSGIEWFGRVPTQWQIRRLGSTVASSQNGVWGEEPQGDEDDIACIRVADFDRQRLVVCEPAEGFTVRSVPQSQRRGRILEQDDFLLEKSGGGEKQLVGAVVRFQLAGPAVCSNFVARVVPKGRHDVHFLAYLYSSLYSARVNSRSVKQNTGIQNLDEKQYLSEPVALPPEEEQYAIADFLDRETTKIDALVEKKVRLIELLQEKSTALITHAVTKGLDPNVPMKDSGIEWLGQIPAHWEVRRMKRLAGKIGSGKTPRGGAESYVAEGAMLIRSQNVRTGALDLDDVVFIDEATDREMADTRVREGDVLLNITGASLGRCCVARLQGGDANVNQHVCIVRPRPRVSESSYLAYEVMSPVVQCQIFETQMGISRDAVNFEQIGDLQLATPPQDEQCAIAEALDRETGKITVLTAKVQEAIERLKEYRTALISAAVTGKLDVRGL